MSEELVQVSPPVALEVVTLPANAQQSLRAAEDEALGLLAALGQLELDYSRERQRLFREVEAVNTKKKQLLDGTARVLGLDIDKAKWNFDFQAMTLTRAD